MGEEIELKLSLGERAMRTLRRRLPLPRVRAEDGGVRRLVSVYFDTPALDLRRHGIGLRVRYADGRRLQTLKCDGGSPIGRFECDQEIEGERPDLTCVSEAGLQDLFADINAPQSLRPLFATEIERTARLLQNDGATIECALDSGEIRAGPKSAPVREAELELKCGRSATLFGTAAALHRRVPLRIEWQTKGQRGYALAAGFVPEPQRWTPPRLTRKMPVAEALGAVVDSCMGQIAAHEPRLRQADDAEAVHKMRVGVRRLRSALSTFRRTLPGDGRLPFESDLRWLQDTLGAARDWDVFAETGLAPLAREGGNGDLRRVRAAATAARAKAYEALRKVLGSRRYTGLLLTLMRWRHELGVTRRGRAGDLREAIAGYAVRELRRRAKQVHKLGGRLEELDARELHRLRIRIKKLRYAIEFFRSLFPAKRVDKQLKRLNGLQDVLGDLNDARTAPRLLQELESLRLLSPRHPLVARGEGLVDGWMAARAAADRRRIEGRWDRYEKSARRWR
jgi:triphosphatase